MREASVSVNLILTLNTRTLKHCCLHETAFIGMDQVKRLKSRKLCFDQSENRLVNSNRKTGIALLMIFHQHISSRFSYESYFYRSERHFVLRYRAITFIIHIFERYFS